MILRSFKIHMMTSQRVLHLGTSYIILKVSKKNREEKQELFGLRKGEKKHKERMREIWRKRKKRKEGKKT